MAQERRFPIGSPILEVKNVSLSFGGVKAITNASFSILMHEIKAIIGPNGAGKSSMLNCINGIYQPQQGSIIFKNELLSKVNPNLIAKKGISRTFQNLALFKRMSVLDNILIGRRLHMNANFIQVAFQTNKARKEEKENRKKLRKSIVTIAKIKKNQNIIF